MNESLMNDVQRIEKEHRALTEKTKDLERTVIFQSKKLQVTCVSLEQTETPS